jgi:hypothetical protein
MTIVLLVTTTKRALHPMTIVLLAYFSYLGTCYVINHNFAPHLLMKTPDQHVNVYGHQYADI